MVRSFRGEFYCLCLATAPVDIDLTKRKENENNENKISQNNGINLRNYHISSNEHTLPLLNFQSSRWSAH